MLSAYDAWANVHDAFYAQCALPEVASDFFLDSYSVKSPAGELLFVGSYSALLPEHLSVSLVLCDLSKGMLDVMRRRQPSAAAVQADVRRLPFRERFSCICMPGAVTAHLLDDLSLSDALRSMSSALRPGGRLYLDAYLPQIAETKYFSGRASFDVGTERWTRIAEIADFDAQRGQLLVDLQFLDPRGQSVYAERLIQRCYSAAALTKACIEHGFRLQKRLADAERGRLYLALQRSR